MPEQQTYRQKRFIEEFKNESDIVKIMNEYYKIFKEKLTSKKFMELFYENID